MSTLFSYFNRVESGSSKTETNKACKDGVQETAARKQSRKRPRLVIESDDSDYGVDAKETPAKADPVEDKNPKLSHVSVSAGQAPLTQVVKKVVSEETYPHNKLKWLQKDNIKDKKGHGVNDSDYDLRTLHVPQDYYKTLTPGFQQWWTIKADNFDSIIMFKVGKFYELYHMDAVIGARELGLTFMKSDFAHCGFPEAGFGRYSNTLVQKGYKVARVEQVETPAMLEKRIKKMGAATKSDRVVRRELCSVVTRGTRTLNFFSDDASDGESVFLLAIKEVPIASEIYNKEYGVCFLDTCVGTFHLGQFKDDGESSMLRMLFAHYPPAHILFERRGLLSHTRHIIDLLLPASLKEQLVPELEFWNPSVTLTNLSDGSYFKDGEWPAVLRTMIDDSFGYNAASDCELAVSALGAVVWCLRRAHVDYSVLSLASFQKYSPLDKSPSLANSNDLSGQSMILDDITLSNLDILLHGNQAGSLVERLDFTVTSFGKRLLRQWVCAPLTKISAIEARQDAVEQLLKNPALMAETKDVLRLLPDLERLLRKIHSQGCYTKVKDHPDSRAIFFEHIIYSKRKIADFNAVLDGLRMSLKLLDIPFQSLNSTLLCKLVDTKEGGLFSDLEAQLVVYENSFDRVKAKNEGIIIPHKGVNQEYDTSQRAVDDILKELDEHLDKQKRKLHCKEIQYWGTGRNRFQLEIPISALSSHKMNDYELTSQKKGYRRYRTPAIEVMLRRLTSAEEERDKALRNTMENLFCSFDQHFVLWEKAVQCLAVLDVLISFATYSLSAAETMCRPVFVKSFESPVLEILDGQHPCIMQAHDGAEFIPNDVLIEGQANFLLVTGPNMGGKSTLMRQTGLLVVLAHLGCYVPASKCRLSPVDRIFTRMGASDKIMAKESTFFVELKETCSILRHATCHSLILVDELGRGTATYDGAAIACAVVQQLAEIVQCRTLFSTHYHFLIEHFTNNPHILVGHMACAVEGGEEESITFLYKLTAGACPKSYGFNVAKLAGIPNSVIALARKKATSCEREAERVKFLRKLFQPQIET